jgi:hypothetical protein
MDRAEFPDDRGGQNEAQRPKAQARTGQTMTSGSTLRGNFTVFMRSGRIFTEFPDFSQ